MNFTQQHFSKYKILVVGDVMLDTYWHGETDRISPEAPVPILAVNQIEQRLGGAANVALNLTNLGIDTRLIGVVGDDANADLLNQKLAENQIDHYLIKTKQPTINKIRLVNGNHQMLRADFEQKFKNHEKDLANILTQKIKDIDLVIFSDYNKGSLNKIEKLIEIVKNKKNNIKILVDPKGKNFTQYKGVDILTPNHKEFTLVVGQYDNEEQMNEKAKKLIDELNLKALLVTCGKDGMKLYQKKQIGLDVILLKTVAKEVYDTTGAGDTVIAVFGAVLAQTNDYLQAMKISNLAAGYVVSKFGTTSISIEQILNQPQESKIYSLDNLLDKIKKHNKQKIVFTNGCFDLLHYGHIQYLKEAKSQGDFLIVAINSDESIKKLKGNSRPLIKLIERMKMLAELEVVDAVMYFEQDTPTHLIEQIKPDVLVKGGDYKSKQEVVGYEFVESYGGKVYLAQCVDGISTTHLINQINKN